MDKNVLITGAGGDIGRAIATLMAKRGCNLSLCGHSQEGLPRLTDFADHLAQAYGIKVAVLRAEVSVKEECERVVRETLNELGTLDVLINNAGTMDYGLLIRTREEDYRKVISCNQDGTFFMMQAAGKIMKQQKRGSIVNITSVAGINGCTGAAAYAASKGAVHMLTKTAAAELANYHIRVNAVAPGMIDGGLSTIMSEEQKKCSSEAIAMRRFGSPDEVAAAVSFLASEEASYITGAILRVDGGLL